MDEPQQRSANALVDVRGLGVCFRLVRSKRASIKDLLFGGWEKPPLLWALRNVDLVCYPGQTLGIVGPNGAGKSTLCLILAQILLADEGEIAVHGRVSAVISPRAALQRHLTGRENVQLFGSLHGLSRRDVDRRIDEIIEFSELGDFIDQPVRFYSLGMRARLGFSLATCLDPQILILDEVMSVGDRAFRAKSQDRMKELMAQSRLIVVVSHSSKFLRGVCTHGLWLEKGRVRMYGAVSEVLDAYDDAMGGVDPGQDGDDG
jgi:ABC-type polysaccharide/polyol phosphate transport system ATPase subunit